MSQDAEQPLKVTGPESIALVLHWDSKPSPVAGSGLDEGCRRSRKHPLHFEKPALIRRCTQTSVQ